MSDAPASSQSIIGLAVQQAQLEEQLVKAYAAGRRAVQLQRRGHPFKVLVDHWTHAMQPQEVRSAFWLGVEDE